LGRVCTALIVSDCPILFLALNCLVLFSPAGGEIAAIRALADVSYSLLFILFPSGGGSPPADIS
jgi:hypothetical protein